MDLAGISPGTTSQPLPPGPLRAGSTATAAVAQPEKKADRFESSGAGEKKLQEEKKNDAETARPGAPRGVNGKALDPEQQQRVTELQRADREVRAHESAHKAVGGSLAGSIGLSYETGPDGRQYAVGGEVGIDSGPEKDPKATITKMQRVIAAALAPANPSSQDRAVAAQAQSRMAAAQAELASAGTPKNAASTDGVKAASAYGRATDTSSSFSASA